GRALLRGLSESRAPQRARPSALGAARPAARASRVLREQDGLGARELVRSARRRSRDRVLLRSPELVSLRGGRAPRLPRGGGAVRPELLRQVSPRRDRGRACPPAPLRQRRGGGARPPRVPGHAPPPPGLRKGTYPGRA